MGSAMVYVIAFGGGLLSFLSPCVLPLVPAYLSVISGIDAPAMAEGGRRDLSKVAASTALFVAGFTLVFTLLGLSASALGQALSRYHLLIERIGGAVLVAMALYLLAARFSDRPLLFFERRFHPNLARFGKFGAPIAGMAFGFGWTPCIGPILASILAVAANSARLGEGALLLAVYSLGLGVPFLLTGLLLARALGAFGFIKRHFGVINVVSAAVLLLFGGLMLLNDFSWVTVHLQEVASAMGLSVLNRL